MAELVSSPGSGPRSLRVRLKALFQFGVLGAAVALRPRWQWALFHLGNAHAEHRGTSAALPYWARACAGPRPPTWPAVQNLAAVLLEAGRAGEATDPLKRYTAATPDDAGAFALLGKVLHKSGDAAGAVAAFERSLELVPAQDGIRLTTALLLEKLKQPPRALEHYRKITDPAALPAARKRISALEK